MKYKLSELIAVKLSGQWGEDCDDPSSGVPVLTVANMGKNGELFLTDATYRTLTGKKLDNAWIKSGDILIAKSGNPKVCFYDGNNNEYVACNFILTLRANENLVLPKYLYYAITNIYNTPYIKLCYTSTTIPNMRVEQFLDCQINVPALEQQKQIVAILDKLYSTISLANQRLLWYDELVKSRFIELFGDKNNPKCDVVKLSSLVRYQQGTQVDMDKQFAVCAEGMARFLRIIDYTQGNQEPRYVKNRGTYVEEDTVCIVRYGTVGFVCKGYNGILANNLFKLDITSLKIDNDFLYCVLKYGTFENDIKSLSNGATMPALSFKIMDTIDILLPSVEKQKEYIVFVEQTDKSKLATTEILKYLEELKAAIMSQYFG